MSTPEVSVERHLIIKAGGREARLDISNCFWCSKLENAVCVVCAEKGRAMKSDLERAMAVIADLCGAGRPAVKESAEQLAEWAEEFAERYYAAQDCTLTSR